VSSSAAERGLFNRKKSGYAAMTERIVRNVWIVGDKGNGPQAAYPLDT
jgi:hypothetical protein